MNTDEKREFFNEWKDNDIYDSLKWKEKLPKYLYRYRPLGEEEKKNEQEFEALKNEKVWASVVSEFNDLNEFAIKASCQIAESDIDKFYEQYCKKVRGENYDKKYFETKSAKILLQSLSSSEYRVGRDNLNNPKALREIKKILKSTYTGKFLSELKNQYMVTCFTEEENSEYMWNEYANEYRGFCVKYKFEDLIKQKFYLLPVVYVDENEKLDVGEYTHKMTLLKYKVDPKNENIIFENENEWRRVERNINNKKNGQLLDIELPIDTIICGDNISEQHRKEIERICKDKGIKL